MGSFKTKEDDVRKISSSIFVTNFPDKCSAKELWEVCKQYGTVVDVFIPDRRFKLSKRFGFVRFVKVFDLDRLVNNLCTLWIGSFKLHANIARFQRTQLSKNNYQSLSSKGDMNVTKDAHKGKGANGYSRSYAHVVNSGSQSLHMNDESPTIVLDETCLNLTKYSTSLMGEVKDFSALTNLKKALAVEGFDNIKINYIGGFWVMMEFKTEITKERFKSNVGTRSWFTQVIQASNDFTINERVTWVDIDGIPLKAWSKNTFTRITSKWGELLYFDDQEEGYLHSKKICIKTKLIENIYESFKIISQGKVFWVRAKEVSGWVPDFEEEEEEDESKYDDEASKEGSIDENENMDGTSDTEEVAETIFEKEQSHAHRKDGGVDDQKGTSSEDPFNIYELLNKKKENNISVQHSEENLQYPPGFTPIIDQYAQSNLPKNFEKEGENYTLNGFDDKVDSDAKKTYSLAF
ncbi:nucleotide-binding alpha-beta plait domain-containing protein [Tanacetum coccineum]